MGDEQSFGAALRQVKEAGLIPEDQIRLCAIADGAGWIWKWVEELFPSARQILDYYHCSRYLHAVAEAQYGGDPVRATQWLEATLGAPVLRRGHRRGVGSANGPVPGGIRKTATPFSPCVLPYTMGSWTGSFSSTAIPLKITKP